MGRKGIGAIICILTLFLAGVGVYGGVLEQTEPEPETESGDLEELDGETEDYEATEDYEVTEDYEAAEDPEDSEESDDIEDSENADAPPEFSFELRHGEFVEQILPWKDKEGVYYVFLPSYANLSELSLSADSSAKILFDGQRLKANKSLAGVYFGKFYDISIAGTQYEITQIEFRKSANVATMHIHVGAEDYFDDDDKDRREKMTLSLLDENGQRKTSELAGTIKGHGNSTWAAAKKPYQIKLDEKESLLGMGSAKKWLLIANAYDPTNLKNKIVFDLAQELFSEWSPQGEYVDVYLNGRYNGLYLLSEKIEVKENRVTKDCECLLEQETVKRARDQEYITDKGIAVEIDYPEDCSKREYAKISESVQQMEDALFASGGSWKKYIDSESWAARYLIDEFSGNFDANKLSSYFYAKAENSGYYYFYGGPVWDYDKAFMQEDADGTPYLFAVAAEYRRRSVWTPYYRRLLEKPAFSKKIKKLYKKKLQSEIKELNETGFDKLCGRLRTASENNFIRWQPFNPPVGYQHDTLEGAIDALHDYIGEKIALMDDKWIAGTQYYIVGIEPGVGSRIREYEVRAGEVFASFPNVRYYHIKNPVWYDRKTKEQYTEPFVPTGDIYLLLTRDQTLGGEQ